MCESVQQITVKQRVHDGHEISENMSIFAVDKDGDNTEFLLENSSPIFE